MTDEYRWQKFNHFAMPKFLLPDAPPSETIAEASAHDDGYDAGYSAGMQAAAVEHEAHKQHWLELLGSLEAERANKIREATRDAAGALKELFRAVFERELRTNDGIVESIVGSLTNSLSEGSYQLTVNPADLEWLSEQLSGLHGLVADPNVRPGTVRAVTESGFTEVRMHDDLAALLDEAFDVTQSHGE